MRAKAEEVAAANRLRLDETKAASLIAGGHKMIEAEWRAAGYEPMVGQDGTLHTPSMLRTVGRWPPPGAKKIERRA
jgi:hypothetical protein